MSASKLEEALLAQITEAGLPAPKTEFEIKSDYLFTRHRPPRRRRFFFDLSWDLYRLLVEVDGGTWSFGRHTRGAGYEADCEKANEAAERDWCVLRFTAAMVKDGRALDQIRRVILRKKKWRAVNRWDEPQGGPRVAPFRVGDVVVCLEQGRADAPLLPMTVTDVDPLIGVKCSWFEDTALCWQIYAPCQLRRAAGHGLP